MQDSWPRLKKNKGMISVDTVLCALSSIVHTNSFDHLWKPKSFFSKICKYEWIFVVASLVAVSGSGQAWLKINTLDIRPRFCQQRPGHTQSELFIKIVLTCWLSVYYQTNPAIINSTWMILNDYWTSATRTILWAFINLIDDDFSFRDKLTQMNVLSCMSVHPFFFSATPHLL